MIERYTLEGNVTPEDWAKVSPDNPIVPVTGPPRFQSRTHPLYLSVSAFR